MLARLGLSLWALSLAASATRAAAQEPSELDPEGIETDCVASVADLVGTVEPPRIAPIELSALDLAPIPAPIEPAPVQRSGVPSGRSVAALTEEACLNVLNAHHISFERLPSQDAEGVGIPIRLHGPIGGVRVESRNRSELHEILDCRLAVAVLSWAPALRAAGVRALLHYSVFRPHAHVAGSSRASGHASGMAIDLAVLEMDDGSEHEVLTGWEARARGAPPCEPGYDEGPSSATMRGLVCGVATSELFQVVLTPHYDGAHANHVHLELRPGVAWQYVR